MLLGQLAGSQTNILRQCEGIRAVFQWMFMWLFLDVQSSLKLRKTLLRWGCPNSEMQEVHSKGSLHRLTKQ